MKKLFHEKTMIYKCFVFLALFSTLVLPASVSGGSRNGNVTGPGRSVISPKIGNDPDPRGGKFREDFLVAVNRARSVKRICGNAPFGHAPPVTWSGKLSIAARLHSTDMVSNNFFSHGGSDGSSAGQRISRQGYPWRAYGENIAVGNPTVSSVIQGWLGSEGHCRNLMDPAFTEIGAGYVIGPFGGNPAARFWTLDLADHR